MTVRLKREKVFHTQSVTSYTVCNLTGIGVIVGEETEACNRPSRMLTQLSREVTQIHKYTNAHNEIQNTNRHTRKVTQIHAITQIHKQNK